ncbi:hypothetical protein ZWY2020_024954 [Hordeum vulgare]|nr:hypothetical protein ZWY2020_024954 [Hordeum vulgare]
MVCAAVPIVPLSRVHSLTPSVALHPPSQLCIHQQCSPVTIAWVLPEVVDLEGLSLPIVARRCLLQDDQQQHNSRRSIGERSGLSVLQRWSWRGQGSSGQRSINNNRSKTFLTFDAAAGVGCYIGSTDPGGGDLSSSMLQEAPVLEAMLLLPLVDVASAAGAGRASVAVVVLLLLLSLIHKHQA